MNKSTTGFVVGVASLVGVVALVAALIFSAVQTRQTQDFATQADGEVASDINKNLATKADKELGEFGSVKAKSSVEASVGTFDNAFVNGVLTVDGDQSLTGKLVVLGGITGPDDDSQAPAFIVDDQGAAQFLQLSAANGAFVVDELGQLNALSGVYKKGLQAQAASFETLSVTAGNYSLGFSEDGFSISWGPKGGRMLGYNINKNAENKDVPKNMPYFFTDTVAANNIVSYRGRLNLTDAVVGSNFSTGWVGDASFDSTDDAAGARIQSNWVFNVGAVDIEHPRAGSVVEIPGAVLRGALTVASTSDLVGDDGVYETWLDGDLRVRDFVRVDGGAAVGGSLAVVGTSTLGTTKTGALTASSAVVNGTSTLNGATAVNGSLTASSAVINGATSVNGSLAASSAVINGATQVNGATTLNGTSTLNGATNVNGSLAASSAVVNGATVVNGTSTLNGATAVNGSLAASSAVVNGATTLHGTVQVNGSLNASSGLDVTGDVNVDGDLNVHSGGLVVGALSTAIGSDLTIDSDADAADDYTFGDAVLQLTGRGLAIANGGITADTDGDATDEFTLDASALTLNDTDLVLAGTSVLAIGAPAEAGYEVTVGGDEYISGNLRVIGSFQAGSTVFTDTTVGSLTATGLATFKAGAVVEGSVSASSAVINGTTNVNGSLAASSAVVNGTTTLHGTVQVNGSLNASSGLAVTGNVNVDGDLNVHNGGLVVGALGTAIGSDLTIDSDADAADDYTFGDAVLQLTGRDLAIASGGITADTDGDATDEFALDASALTLTDTDLVLSGTSVLAVGALPVPGYQVTLGGDVLVTGDLDVIGAFRASSSTFSSATIGSITATGVAELEGGASILGILDVDTDAAGADYEFGNSELLLSGRDLHLTDGTLEVRNTDAGGAYEVVLENDVDITGDLRINRLLEVAGGTFAVDLNSNGSNDLTLTTSALTLPASIVVDAPGGIATGAGTWAGVATCAGDGAATAFTFDAGVPVKAVVITPAQNPAGEFMTWWAVPTAPGASTFTINVDGAPSGNVDFNYIVIQ